MAGRRQRAGWARASEGKILTVEVVTAGGGGDGAKDVAPGFGMAECPAKLDLGATVGGLGMRDLLVATVGFGMVELVLVPGVKALMACSFGMLCISGNSIIISPELQLNRCT